MSTADFAAFSNNAIMFASIVYVLAFLAHVVEWAARARAGARPRASPAASRSPSALGGRPPAATHGAAAPRRRRPDARTAGRPVGPDRRRADRRRAALLHCAGLVTRGLGSDPVRVPWGNMYEFTLAGAFGVSADVPRAAAAATSCAGWACS